MSREQTFINTKTGKKVTIASETLKYILPSKMKFLKPYETEIKQYPPEFLNRRLQPENEKNATNGNESGIDNGTERLNKDSQQEGTGNNSLPAGVPKTRIKRK